MEGTGKICCVTLAATSLLFFCLWRRELRVTRALVCYLFREVQTILTTKRGAAVIQLLLIRKRMFSVMRKMGAARYLPAERRTKFRKIR